MNKNDIQKRVLKDGEPLALKNFSWCEKTKTFSSSTSGLILDFRNITNCTFKTGPDCTFKAGTGCTFDTDSGCTFDTSPSCTFTTSPRCTFDTGPSCTFTTGPNCTFDTGSGCTFDTSPRCTFKTGPSCTFTTGPSCTFDTGSGCTFDTGPSCTFKTGPNCTFKTGSGYTFKTGSDCTFDTGSDCTFTTGPNCTFKTGPSCVIVRRDVFEVIQPLSDSLIQLCPSGVAGYLTDGKLDGVPHIIADGILSRVISKKGDVYKVVNHSKTNVSYVIKRGEVYSHGETLKQAQESLVFKLKDKDTSAYADYTLDTELSFEDCIAMYRTITGACEFGVRSFVESQPEVKDRYTVKEIIELTRGQYGHQQLIEFFVK